MRARGEGGIAHRIPRRHVPRRKSLEPANFRGAARPAGRRRRAALPDAPLGRMEGVDHDEHGFEVPPNLVTTFKLHRQGTSTSTLGAPPPPAWPDLLAQARLKQYRAREALPPRFHAAVCDGIPAAHRAEAWLLLTGAGKRLEEQPGEYAHLLEEGRRVAAEGSSEEDVEEQIDRDLHRTFPGHPSLTPSFIATVKDVLLAYSQRNPEVAYCQVRHRVRHVSSAPRVPCIRSHADRITSGDELRLRCDPDVRARRRPRLLAPVLHRRGGPRRSLRPVDDWPPSRYAGET